jgi:D-lactate dehydrogenase (cytochrome)
LKYNPLNQEHLKNLQALVPAERISIGESNLDLHSQDQSQHTPVRPEVVIWPTDRSEVSGIVRYADQNLIPVTGWGSGSSLEGNPIPVQKGIVLDFSQMNRIIAIREEDFQADVEPGVIYQDLNTKLRHKGLFFAPDPGARATLGGIIANNSSGTTTVRYGATKAHILRLTVVLASGEIIAMGTRASKTSSGYDLIHLFVGSEGTLGIVVEATVHLVGLPVEFSAAIVNFPDIQAAGKTVFKIMRSGFDPAALEILDPECVTLINKEKGFNLNISPTLFMEFHGPSKEQLATNMEMVLEVCKEEKGKLFQTGIGRAERDRLFEARHQLGEMIPRNHPDCKNMVVDVAVPISAYPEMIAFARAEADKTGIPAYIFSHSGDGNLHVVFAGKKGNKREWAILDQVNERMVYKALSFGGTATGEHGIGLGKRKYMEAEHGKSLEWMKKIKDLLDPNHILNPGKMFP